MDGYPRQSLNSYAASRDVTEISNSFWRYIFIFCHFVIWIPRHRIPAQISRSPRHRVTDLCRIRRNDCVGVELFGYDSVPQRTIVFETSSIWFKSMRILLMAFIQAYVTPGGIQMSPSSNYGSCSPRSPLQFSLLELGLIWIPPGVTGVWTKAIKSIRTLLNQTELVSVTKAGWVPGSETCVSGFRV